MTPWFYDRSATQVRLTDSLPTTGMRSQVSATVATGIPCSIQMKARMSNAGYAEDDTKAVGWVVLVDPSFAGTFQVNDELTDDLGRQFRVRGAYPTPMGWQLAAEDLTAGGK